MSILTMSEINEAVDRKLGLYAARLPGDLIPDYCGSIQAAWEIVEYLQKTNSLEIIPRKDGKTMVIIQTDNYPYKEKGIASVSDTAPMSICLAFLKLP